MLSRLRTRNPLEAVRRLDKRPLAKPWTARGTRVAGFAAVHPDASGDICLFTKASADLVWDQVAETNVITAAAPQRLLDTRTESSHLG